MIFKDDKDKRDYQNISLKPSRENLELRKFVEILEAISDLLGFGELTITDYLRDDPHSLHHYGQAVDIRIHDKPATWYWCINLIGLGLGILNPRFRVQPHHEEYNKFVVGQDAQPHIHVEVRTRK